ncbi:MarR family winged helix-turn-helix transcriptional regulator [Bradyrhizobium oligotrophicum]|uniref:MarR family winged helix-turn-helix transcriptional regulator n=2 Tax=Nitrobacteraceae TaxID=41294 RepID=UPI003EC10B69
MLLLEIVKRRYVSKTSPHPPSSTLSRNVMSNLKDPSNIDEYLAFRIYNLGKLAARGAGIMLRRELGIGRRDWRILAYVAQRPGISLSELAEVADIELEPASRGVGRLVGSGIIAKTRLPKNKRLLALSLTDTGQALYEQAQRITKAYNRDLAACLSDEHAQILDMLLRRLSERAAELTDLQAGAGGEEDIVE